MYSLARGFSRQVRGFLNSAMCVCFLSKINFEKVCANVDSVSPESTTQ